MINMHYMPKVNLLEITALIVCCNHSLSTFRNYAHFLVLHINKEWWIQSDSVIYKTMQNRFHSPTIFLYQISFGLAKGMTCQDSQGRWGASWYLGEYPWKDYTGGWTLEPVSDLYAPQQIICDWSVYFE